MTEEHGGRAGENLAGENLANEPAGSVVALAVARLPASVRSPVIATLVLHRVLRPVCVEVCVCLSMACSETTRTVSSVLSPVSVGVQNFT